MKRLRGGLLLLGLGAALLASILAAVCLGTVEQLPPSEALAILLHKLRLAGQGQWSATEEFIVLQSRLPRVVVAAIVGAGLAVAGCCLQGMFNNPLASPGVLGVSSGGALGAVIAIVLGLDAMGVFYLPAAAFGGALIAAFAVYGIATRHGRTPVAALLLAGIAMNAVLGSGVSFFLTHKLDDYEASKRIVYWLVGDLEARQWEHAKMAAPPVLLGSLWALFLARDLNSLALGEETARSLGIAVQRFKVEVLVAVSIVTGASVAVSGVLGFVGLIVPHIARLLIGPDHRRLLPASFLGGGIFLVLIDLASRTLVRPQEIRAGILTSLLGGPFFIFLMIWNRRKLETF